MKKLPLKNGKHALVDDRDFEIVRHYRWYELSRIGSRTSYAITSYKSNGKWKSISLHKFLMKPAKGLHVDHINFDGLDCRRINMRLVTPKQNGQHRNPEAVNNYADRAYAPYGGKMGKFKNFAGFFRNVLSEKNLSVKKASVILDPIGKHRLYTFIGGHRLPMTWQIKFMEKKLGFDTPWEILFHQRNFVNKRSEAVL